MLSSAVRCSMYSKMLNILLRKKNSFIRTLCVVYHHIVLIIYFIYHINLIMNWNFRDKRRQYDKSLERIRNIIHTLEELLVLKERYNLRISFEDYHKVLVTVARCPKTIISLCFFFFTQHINRAQSKTVVSAYCNELISEIFRIL